MGRGRTPGKRTEREAVDSLDPTADLRPAAAAKFAQIVAMLAAENMLYRSSADALTRYCQLWMRNQAANAIINDEGPVIEAGSGGKKRHPACSEADSTEKAMMAIARELGLTSVSAGRVGGGGANPQKDELGEFLAEGK